MDNPQHTMKSDPCITVRDLTMAYDSFVVMKDLNFTINRGDIFIIMGGSGCGKTTLLRLIGGTVTPSSGYVKVDNQIVHDLGRNKLFSLRRKMSMLFQFGALFTDLSVFDNVAFQMREHTDLPESVIRDLVLMKLHAVGLRGAHNLMPAELSGGERQRVAIARALINEPDLLLADEPTGNLDKTNSDHIHSLLMELNREFSMTLVVVTHNMELATLVSRRVTIANGALQEFH